MLAPTTQVATKNNLVFILRFYKCKNTSFYELPITWHTYRGGLASPQTCGFILLLFQHPFFNFLNVNSTNKQATKRKHRHLHSIKTQNLRFSIQNTQKRCALIFSIHVPNL